MGGDVACAAGISVHAPGATDVRATFQNHVRAQSGLLQANGYAKTAKAAADDQTFKVRSHDRHQQLMRWHWLNAVRGSAHQGVRFSQDSQPKYGEANYWSDEELLALARRKQANDMAVQDKLLIPRDAGH